MKISWYDFSIWRGTYTNHRTNGCGVLNMENGLYWLQPDVSTIPNHINTKINNLVRVSAAWRTVPHWYWNHINFARNIYMKRFAGNDATWWKESYSMSCLIIGGSKFACTVHVMQGVYSVESLPSLRRCSDLYSI